MVASPHPDDETFGCGGLIALAAGRGISVHPVFCTDGEAIEREPFEQPPAPGTDIGQLRRRETVEAAGILGARNPIHLGLPDGGLPGQLDRLVSALETTLEDLSPALLLAPWPGEQHADHVAVSRAATRLALQRGLALAYYEVNTPLCPNQWLDIGDVLERKRAAIMAYHYSLYGKPEVFWDAIAGLNAYRTFFFIRRGWHEAFHVPEGSRARDALERWCASPLDVPPGCGPLGPWHNV